MRARRMTLIVVVIGLCASTAGALDWPQWRGPQRDGISQETGLLKEWPKDGPKLLWQLKDIGDGYSTLAVVGDRLFVINNKGMDDEFVQAMATEDGKTESGRSCIGKVGPNSGPQYPARPSRRRPSTETCFTRNRLRRRSGLALDTASGDIRWQKNWQRDLPANQGVGLMRNHRWSTATSSFVRRGCKGDPRGT